MRRIVGLLQVEVQAGQTLDLAQLGALGRIDQRDRDTGLAGAGRAADAVHVAFRLFRQVEVHDMGDVVDMDAAGHDVGGDEHADRTGLELAQRLLAGTLALVAVDRAGVDAGLLQIGGELVGAVLGAGEDHRLLEIGLRQMLDEPELLGLLRHQIDALVDLLDGDDFRRHLDPDRIGQDLGGQLFHRTRHGGREQQRLAVGRKLRDDAHDVLDEAHVEHPVGLVENDVVDFGQRQGTLVQQVEQTARRRDDDVDAAAHRLDLRTDRDTAEDHVMGQLGAGGVGFDVAGDLRGELAGRGQDEDLRRLRSRATALGDQRVDDGQREGRGLAGAGLGDTQNVAALHDRRNRLGLDRRRLGDVETRKRGKKRVGEAERLEIGMGQDMPCGRRTLSVRLRCRSSSRWRTVRRAVSERGTPQASEAAGRSDGAG